MTDPKPSPPWQGLRPTGNPCPTCGATYGQPVNKPNRCGVCLTGLSMDGKPVHPTQQGDKWVSPITGMEAVQLRDGTWTIMLSDTALALLDSNREKWIQSAEDRRARGEW